jgi:hypothetical protein
MELDSSLDKIEVSVTCLNETMDKIETYNKITLLLINKLQSTNNVVFYDMGKAIKICNILLEFSRLLYFTNESLNRQANLVNTATTILVNDKFKYLFKLSNNYTEYYLGDYILIKKDNTKIIFSNNIKEDEIIGVLKSNKNLLSALVCGYKTTVNTDSENTIEDEITTELQYKIVDENYIIKVKLENIDHILNLI